MEEQQLDSEHMSDSMIIITALGNRNPGAYDVISKLFTEINESNKSTNFITKLLEKNIVGARLWYIYKNEAELNINNLLQLNLDNFTDSYFYEKFEKHCS